MKTFNKITVEAVLEAHNYITNNLGGIPMQEVDPNTINWEALAEYIFEVWGNEYDNDDIDFVHDHLYVSPDADFLFVLEINEDKYGNEVVAVEALCV